MRPGPSSPKARQVSLFLPRRKSIVRGSFELLCDRLRSFFRVLVDKFAIRRDSGAKLPISARGGALPGPPGGALHPAKVCPGPRGGRPGLCFTRRKCCGRPGPTGRTLPDESAVATRGCWGGLYPAKVRTWAARATLRHSALLKSTCPLGRRTFALCHGKACGPGHTSPLRFAKVHPPTGQKDFSALPLRFAKVSRAGVLNAVPGRRPPGGSQSLGVPGGDRAPLTREIPTN